MTIRRALAALALVVMGPGIAAAHPVDEVVQGAYLTLAPGALRLELDLSPGVEVVGTLLAALDADGDQTITDAEARAYGAAVLAQSALTLDGATAAWTVDEVIVPAYANLALGADILKVVAHAERRDSAGAHTLTYRNDYAPVRTQRAANIFLQPGDGWQYAVAGQERGNDGTALTVDYTVTRP